MGDVYNRYIDTAGRYHWTDTGTGEHTYPPYTEITYPAKLSVGTFYPNLTNKDKLAEFIMSHSSEEVVDKLYWLMNYGNMFNDQRGGIIDWLNGKSEEENRCMK